MTSPPRAWAEIDLEALRHNYRFAQECSGGADVMAVVKANAYGHGVAKVVQALHDLHPAFYGVANVAEAREVREILPQARIYLLGAANPSEYEELIANEFTPCASTIEELQALAQVAQSQSKQLKLHLALDTGMGRGGFIPESDEYQAALTYSHPNIQIEGIGSHLPVADEDPDFTVQQFANFKKFAPHTLQYTHLANSAGIMDYDSTGLNLIRPGLMLYGASPLPAYQRYLRPVMSLKSRVSLVRHVPAGHSVSYGRTFITKRPSQIATVGIGYADGILRSISGSGAQVFLNGHFAPIVGRITMDQIMIDVTDLDNCIAGHEVEIFGKNILANTFAEQAQTIAWEIFTGIAPRVTRV